jgi:hypothetical protein
LPTAILAMGSHELPVQPCGRQPELCRGSRLNGFAYGATTTLYMAFYVDSLAPEENRSHAMGYYVGSLALGYSTGNFFGG